MDQTNHPQTEPEIPNEGVGKVVQLLIAGAAFIEALAKLIEAFQHL